MGEYYDQLAQDLCALGMDGVVYQTPELYRDLHDIIRTAGIRMQYPEELETDFSARMQTRLGTLLMDMLVENEHFENVEGYRCCSEAEVRLLKDMADHSDTTGAQPIVLVEGGEPVGIIKADGEPTCYGLVTEYNLGLIRGVISAQATHAYFNPYEYRSWPARRPWAIEASAVDYLYPVRPSMFTVPVGVRRHLVANERRGAVLATSHRQITERARQLLASAIPIDVGDLYPALPGSR